MDTEKYEQKRLQRLGGDAYEVLEKHQTEDKKSKLKALLNENKMDKLAYN